MNSKEHFIRTYISPVFVWNRQVNIQVLQAINAAVPIMSGDCECKQTRTIVKYTRNLWEIKLISGDLLKKNDDSQCFDLVVFSLFQQLLI